MPGDLDNEDDGEPRSPGRWHRAKLLYKGVLGVGALAAAIAAVLALRPPADVEDVAELRLTIVEGMPLAEHVAAFEAPHPRPVALPVFRPVAYTSPTPVPSSCPVPTAGQVPAAVPEISGTQAPDSIPTPNPSESPAEPTMQPPAESSSTASPPTPPPSPSCSPDTDPGAPNGTIAGSTVLPVRPGRTEKPISRKAASEDQIGAIADLRPRKKWAAPWSSAPTTRPAPRRPVPETEDGVQVMANMTLKGLRKKSVRLNWSMVSKKSGVRLSQVWQNRDLGYQLVPTSNNDTASIPFWVPMPGPEFPGPYFIRVTLAVGDASPLVSTDSETFG